MAPSTCSHCFDSHGCASQADSRSPHRLFVVSHRLTVSMGRKREVPPQYSVFTERAAVLRQRVEEMARNGTAEPAQNRGFAASNSQPEMPMLTQSLDVTAYKQYCHFLLQQLERSKVAFDALREEYCKLRQRTGPPYSDVDALLCQAPETGAIPGLPPMNGVVNLDGTSPRTILANDVADANGLSWLASPKQTPERASVHMPRLPTPPSKDSTSAPLPPFHGLTNVDAPPGLNAALGVSADGVNTTAVPLPTAAQVRDLAAGVLGLHANRQMPSTEASLRPNVSNTSLHSLLSDKSSEELLTCLLNSLMLAPSPQMKAFLEHGSPAGFTSSPLKGEAATRSPSALHAEIAAGQKFEKDISFQRSSSCSSNSPSRRNAGWVSSVSV